MPSILDIDSPITPLFAGKETEAQGGCSLQSW